jgi:uncharacterized protein YfaS (alpha-2-macroglobulin family)
VKSFTQAAVMFNQPMVALGDLDRADQSLLTLDPPLPGKVAWINQYTLAFVPDAPALGTLTVKARLSPEVTSLSGTRLDGPRETSFTLPALAVDWSLVVSGDYPETALKPVVSVNFNQPVDPDSINGMSFFVWGPEDAPERIPARWLRLSGGAPAVRHLRAEPAGEFPRAVKWALVIVEGASAAPGLPPLGADFVAASGETYGDLTVSPSGFDETEGDGPDGIGVLLQPEQAELRLSFSNPVMMSRAAAFIEMEPRHPRMAELLNRWVKSDASPGGAAGAASIDSEAPAAGAASVDSEAPAAGAASVDSEAPADGEASAEPGAPADGAASAADEAPADGAASAEPEAPADGAASVDSEATAAGAASAEPEAPAVGAASAADDGPAEDEDGEFALNGISLWKGFLAETDYVITFRKGMPDVYGQTLAEDRVIRFRTGPFAPDSGLDSPGGILESALPPLVPVWIRNLPKAGFFARVMTDAETAGMLDVWNAEFGHGPYSSERLTEDAKAWLGKAIRRGPGLFTADVAPSGDSAKAMIIQPLDLSDLAGAKAKDGVLLAGSRDGDSFSLYQVTDLALTVKVGSSGSLAWVTRLLDASPVPGAAVRALDCRGRELWAGETGEDGLARLPGGLELAGKVGDGCGKGAYWATPLHFTASRDGERVFWSLGWAGDFDAYGLGIRDSMIPSCPDWVESFLLTSQPVYKPGETARLKAVIRRFGGEGLFSPEPGPARAIIHDPRGTAAFDGPVEVSPYGTVSLDYPIPEDAAYGEWRLTVDLAPEKGRDPDGLARSWRGTDHAAAGGFSVRFYRPPAFELDLGGTPDRLAGETARFTAKGTFHYGAALDGGEAEFDLSRRPEWDYRPQGYGPEWSFTARAALERDGEGGWEADADPPGTAAAGRAPIAPDGTASFETVIPADGPPVPRAYTLAVTALDRDGRAVGASGSFLAHPARLYAGLSAKGFLAEAGKPFPLKVAVAAPDGAAAPGTAVKVSLYRRAWSSARRLAPGGHYAVVRESFDALVSELALTSGEGPLELEVTPRAAGAHFAVAEVTDPEGRKALASLDFWATGGGVAGEGAGWRSQDDESLELAADAKEYAPGDVARILVQSPFSAGTGLLTVERGGVGEARVFGLDGGAPVLEIPIGEGDAPSIYVSVVLARGRTAPPPLRGGGDPGKPAFRRGYLTLKVASGRERLNVEVAPDREAAEPGAPVSVKVRVTDSAGNPFPDCEVALAAVDAGLVQIGGDGAFRPEALLWRDLPLRVQTASSLAHVLEAYDWSGKGLGEPGGGGGYGPGPDNGVRRDFRPVAHFDPAVALDENGEATVSFRLPDGLTSYRVFAVAVGKGREAGTGEAGIMATQTLVLRSALPNHLTAGDEFQAGAVVTSRASEEAELTVEILPRAGLELLEESRKSLALRPGESVEVAFRARASAAGTLEAGFDATLAGASDRSLFAVPVSPAGRLTADASVSVEGAGSAIPETRLPEGADPSRGGLELVFSPGVAGALDAPLGALEDYPYDCLEQSTSRAAGALYELRLGAYAGTTADDRRSELEGRVREQIALLASRSLGGGYSSWPEGGWRARSPVLTAWILDFVREAAETGFEVPERLVGPSVDYLAEEISGGRRNPDDCGLCGSDTESLYVMGALFRAGRPLEGTLEPYYSRREELGLVQRILLLRAADALPPSRVRTGQLMELIPMVASELELSGTIARVKDPGGREERGLWISGADDLSAQALLALSEAAPHHALLPALVLGNMSPGKSGSWSTNRAVSVIRGAWNFLEAERAAASVPSRPPLPSPSADVSPAPGAPSASGSGSGDPAAAPALDLAVKVLQGDRTVMEGRLDGPRSPALRAGVTAAELLAGPPPAWDIEGRGELWSFRRLAWAPLEPDLSAQGARGITLTRSFRRVRPEPGPVGESKFRRGEVVKVTVTLMTNVARRDLALEDPVPAGLEPVDFHLGDQNPGLAALSADAYGSRDPWVLLWNWYDHAEIRPDSVRLFADDLAPGVYTYSYLARAVTPGIYALPGPYAEEMYNPENFGRGAGLRITVER